MSLSPNSGLGFPERRVATRFYSGVNRRRGQENRLHNTVTATAAEATEPAETPVPLNVPSSRRVLVVDDNRDLAESLAMILRFWGHDVIVAYNGREALELAKSRPPDVVFLDIGLPHLDGFEVARQMRADAELRRARIVAITGYGREEDRQRSRDVGFDLHLTKPVDPWQLQALLG
jgi:two-component system CheB/CheR fusion protein